MKQIIYFLDNTQQIKINNSKYYYMKNDEVFLNYMINNFVVSKTKLSKPNKNKNRRNIYVIMQNTIIINYIDNYNNMNKNVQKNVSRIHGSAFRQTFC